VKYVAKIYWVIKQDEKIVTCSTHTGDKEGIRICQVTMKEISC